MRAGPTVRIFCLALALGGPSAAAQAQVEFPVSIDPAPKRPFAIGERLTYGVRVGSLGRGRAVMELLSLDTIRDREVFHSTFKIDGKLLFFKVDDLYESWFDPHSLVSLRYHQNIDQGAYERDRTYEIFPEKGTYIGPDKLEVPSVELPLDDGAFLYFLRTIPLEVGKTYTFNRYFKPDRNPVRVTVVRKERIRVPAGDFDAIVLQPTIKAKGIFAENARAEVWVQDDENRMMLMMKTHMQFGMVTFQLRSKENLKDKVAEK